MKTAKVLSAMGIMLMTIALIYGFAFGNFFGEGSKIASMPWGIVSLVDLYTGFTLFSIWIFYREKSLTMSIFWTIAMMTLGFFAGSLYTFLALYKSGGDWKMFWMGKQSTS